MLITTQEFTKLTAEKFAASLKQANVVNKTDFDNKLQALRSDLLQVKQNIQKLNSIIEKDYNFFLDIFFFTNNDRSQIMIDLFINQLFTCQN